MPKIISEEVKQEIVERVKNELEKHKQDNTFRLTANYEIGETYSIHPATVYKRILSEAIPIEVLKERSDIIRLQRKQEFWNVDENKKRFVEKVGKLSAYGCALLAHHHTNSTTPRAELAAVYGIGVPSICGSIRRAIGYGLFTWEEYRAGTKRRMSYFSKNRITSKDSRRKMSLSRTGKHFSEETLAKRSKARKGKYTGKDNPRYGTHLTEEQKEYMSKLAKERCFGLRLAKYRQNKYGDGTNTYSSKDEFAVASALQKYITGFKLENGITFQVWHGDEINGHRVSDFVLPKVIVEWHPINVVTEAKNFGKKGSLEALEAMKPTLKPEEKSTYSAMLRDFENDLATDYWMDRQEFSDRYCNGKDVVLARHAYELYDLVISKYGDKTKIPSRIDFAREFRKFRTLAQPVQKEKKDLEQKVEAVAV